MLEELKEEDVVYGITKVPSGLLEVLKPIALERGLEGEVITVDNINECIREYNRRL